MTFAVVEKRITQTFCHKKKKGVLFLKIVDNGSQSPGSTLFWIVIAVIYGKEG